MCVCVCVCVRARTRNSDDVLIIIVHTDIMDLQELRGGKFHAQNHFKDIKMWNYLNHMIKKHFFMIFKQLPQEVREYQVNGNCSG